MKRCLINLGLIITSALFLTSCGGTGEVGTSCSSNADCLPELECLGSSTEGFFCTDLNGGTGEVGTSCITNADCLPALDCIGSSTEGFFCTDLSSGTGGVGTSCSSNADCLPALECMGSSTEGFVCTDLNGGTGEVGTSCSSNADCLPELDCIDSSVDGFFCSDLNNGTGDVGTSCSSTFTFGKIAESIDTDAESLRGSPGLNNNGTVVYYDKQNIYKYDEARHLLFAVTGSVYSSISFYPSMNDSEWVTFGVFEIDGLWATLSSDGSSEKTIVSNAGNNFSYISSHGEINNNGYVSSWAKNLSNEHLIYLSDGSNYFKIADTSGVYATLLTDTAINNNNSVAYIAYYADGSEIIVGDGIESNKITDTKGQFKHFNFGEIDLNDVGKVAFRAALDDGREAVVLADQESYKIVAETSSGYETFSNGGFDGVSVNNLNEVVFWAKANGAGGIYLGGKCSVVKIIGVKDKLDGNTIIDLFVGNDAINDSGQIVFKATLERENGSQYYSIYRANPSEM